jgi:hypothetical protein
VEDDDDDCPEADFSDDFSADFSDGEPDLPFEAERLSLRLSVR